MDINDQMARDFAAGLGSGYGAKAAEESARAAENYIDPPLLGHSTPPVKTYDQYERLKSYDGWDGDMRWPHPQFTLDEAERAKNYNNRQKVGYLRDQAQISAYKREIAENKAARREIKYGNNQPTQSSQSGQSSQSSRLANFTPAPHMLRKKL